MSCKKFTNRIYDTCEADNLNSLDASMFDLVTRKAERSVDTNPLSQVGSFVSSRAAPLGLAEMGSRISGRFHENSRCSADKTTDKAFAEKPLAVAACTSCERPQNRGDNSGGFDYEHPLAEVDFFRMRTSHVEHLKGGQGDAMHNWNTIPANTRNDVRDSYKK